ncbi:MAG: PQQ-binding-like beta-propeller repeat protein, partial [Candidatus Bathyarchaeota archaeon]|nr:PQQ-binding-like beta-propeller repeat protein [Candidatus Bathyarchaeota archaeon]
GSDGIHALDASSGIELWNFSSLGSVSSPAVADGILYVGSTDDRVYALNASTGNTIWSYTTGDCVFSSPCVADGKVFIGSDDGKVYALDASTGANLWSFTTHPHGVSFRVRSSPAFSDGKVYVGSQGTYPDTYFFALNAHTGALIWNFSASVSFSSPAVADGKVFVNLGRICALNASAGTVKWSYDTGCAASTSSPAIANGRVYVGDGTKVYCFGPMLYFNITVDPQFYDNRGKLLTPAPSSWTISFPNRTKRVATGPEAFIGSMGAYAIERVVWKSHSVPFGGYEYGGWIEAFLVSNTTWSPRVDCTLPTDLAVSLSSSTSFVGFKVGIDGNLTCNEEGVSQASVLLSYSVTGGETWNDVTLVQTEIDGTFSALWVPSATGYYVVKAVWSGNTTFPGSSSTVNLAVLPLEEQSVFSVTSNSTISAFTFESEHRELCFTVTGPPGTCGYVNVHIAKSLIADTEDIEVKLNDEEIDFTVTSLDDSWLLRFTCQHSTHTVKIALGEASTAFLDSPLEQLLIYAGVPFIVAIALVALYMARKKRTQTKQDEAERQRKQTEKRGDCFRCLLLGVFLLPQQVVGTV